MNSKLAFKRIPKILSHVRSMYKTVVLESKWKHLIFFFLTEFYFGILKKKLAKSDAL
jgi:hypothetical protein